MPFIAVFNRRNDSRCIIVKGTEPLLTGSQDVVCEQLVTAPSVECAEVVIIQLFPDAPIQIYGMQTALF